jgi:hypothetical protein
MFPASIFVYELREPSEPGEGFDLQDNYSAMTIGVRLGNVGLLAALQDSEVMRSGLGDRFTRYRPLTLHQNQFKY